MTRQQRVNRISRSTIAQARLVTDFASFCVVFLHSIVFIDVQLIFVSFLI